MTVAEAETQPWPLSPPFKHFIALPPPSNQRLVKKLDMGVLIEKKRIMGVLIEKKRIFSQCPFQSLVGKRLNTFDQKYLIF